VALELAVSRLDSDVRVFCLIEVATRSPLVAYKFLALLERTYLRASIVGGMFAVIGFSEQVFVHLLSWTIAKRSNGSSIRRLVSHYCI